MDMQEKALTSEDIAPLAQALRGKYAESTHFGVVAVVDSRGNAIVESGNNKVSVCLRSVTKPIQVLPLADGELSDRYGLNTDEIALMAGSHNGEEIHIQVMKNILRKINLTEDDLLCGPDWPIHEPTRAAMQKRRRRPTKLHNPCSGKHAAILTMAKAWGYPLDNYTDPNHPVQQVIRDYLADLAGVPSGKVFVSIDGCEVPVFWLPMYNAALVFARLIDPQSVSPSREESIRYVAKAMQDYPDMVGGDGRITTELYRSVETPIIAKSGAEGLFCLGYMRNGVGYGLALKIIDGADRALEPVLIEILKQLGVIPQELPKQLQPFQSVEIKTLLGNPVGQIKPVVELDISESYWT